MVAELARVRFVVAALKSGDYSYPKIKLVQSLSELRRLTGQLARLRYKLSAPGSMPGVFVLPATAYAVNTPAMAPNKCPSQDTYAPAVGNIPDSNVVPYRNPTTSEIKIGTTLRSANPLAMRKATNPYTSPLAPT